MSAVTTQPTQSPQTPTASLATASVPSPYNEIASDARLAETVKGLESRGIRAILVDTREQARTAVLSLVPEGSEVLDATSQTLVALGLLDTFASPDHYHGIRGRLTALRAAGDAQGMRKLGAAPDFVVGSVHAVTESGQVVIASASGSQLGPYAFGAGKVVWVVGAQKVVRDMEEAFRRIETYSLPLENARAQVAYGMNSVLAKLLVIHREITPGRITMILVKENLGF